MKVFVFGSKNIHYLPKEFTNIIDSFCSKNYEFIVGDCYGVDSHVVSYLLHEKGYSNKLTVYHVGRCRNEMYGIKKNKIELSQEYLHGSKNKYHAKDDAMIEDCDAAIALWDGISKGSQRNINKLLRLNKPIRVIFEGENTLYD